jgi:hypothetical protein
MAQWIFTQTTDSTGQDCARSWTWQLERSDNIIKRSDRSFPDLVLCMDDATHYGYYAGHYAVHIRTHEMVH